MSSPRSAGSAYESAWEAAAYDIASRGIRGLQVWCPMCRRTGTLVSKWLPSIPVKPVYVIHPFSQKKKIRACALSAEKARSAKCRVRFNSRDVPKTLRMGRPFVLFSGGRDSLCLLEYMQDLAKQAGLRVTAIHADTTAGFPEVEDYVDAVCKKMGVELIVVRPERDYFDLAKRWGIPGVRSRWCCETLKIAPIRRYLAQVEGPKVIYDGIRAAESNLRATYLPIWYHPAFKTICVSPIFYWSDNRVEDYIKRQGLPPNPTVDMGTSGECWCGAYKCRGDFEALLDVHPDIFEKLVQVEKAQRGEFTFLYEGGRRVPLESLRDETSSKAIART